MTDRKEGGAAAFFDVDYTILSSNSATLFVKFLMKEKRVGIGALLNNLQYVLRYKLNLLDFERLAEREAAKFSGMEEREMIELCERWFEEMVVSYIYREAVEKIEEHRSEGHELVLLSAATVYLARPLARNLDIPHYLCNRLEIDGASRFTGKLVKPFCYGRGKVHWAEELARERGMSLADSYYYSDSITDLPVLERFGRPVVVNPDPLLGKEARKRGWPVLDFRS